MKNKLILSLLMLIGFNATGQHKVAVFSSDVFSQFPNVRDIAISPDGNELYFTAQSTRQDFSAILISTKQVEGWNKPKVASFSGKYRDLEPFLSHDGLLMYFASNRPVPGRENEKPNFDIWKVERATLTSKWSTPENLGTSINSELNEYYPSITKSGNLYFTADRDGTKGNEDIFFSIIEGGQYSEPKSLPEAINTKGYEFNSFVDYNEQYIIYTGYGRENGFGGGDLYISKKNDQGEWLPSKHLGKDINSQGLDYCPFVYNDILYFTSNRSNIKTSYENALTVKTLLEEFNQTGNGKSKLYKVLGSDWLGD
ncbi:MAG: hypothetical protein ABFS32_01785 [Bacteroidota bacterium]